MLLSLMWYDNSKKSINDKILDAARCYLKKFGVEPNAAIVNPSDFRDINVEGIQVVAQLRVMKNYVLIGVGK